MMYVAIIGFIVLLLLVVFVQPIMMILDAVRPIVNNDLLIGVLGLIGVVVVISFFWFAGEAIT